MAHISQSRPDSGHCLSYFQVSVLTSFECVPFSQVALKVFHDSEKISDGDPELELRISAMVSTVYATYMQRIWNVRNVWNVYGMCGTYMKRIWNVWNVYGTYMECMKRVWNVYGMHETCMERIWNARNVDGMYGTYMKRMQCICTLRFGISDEGFEHRKQRLVMGVQGAKVRCPHPQG